MKILERKTARLVIRPYQASDFNAWRQAHLGMLPPKNTWDGAKRKPKELTRAFFRKVLQVQKIARKKDSQFDLGIFLKSDGTLIGFVGLMDISRGVFQNAYIGYRIFNRYWHQGYGKEAIKASVDIAFKDIKLHRIEAGIEPGNHRSILLAKSLKMRFEGKKSRSLYLRGHWVDILIYTLTSEDVGIKFRGKTPSLKSKR